MENSETLLEKLKSFDAMITEKSIEYEVLRDKMEVLRDKTEILISSRRDTIEEIKIKSYEDGLTLEEVFELCYPAEVANT